MEPSELHQNVEEGCDPHPVLDPPPGFQDSPIRVQHYYDDPYCGDDEALDTGPKAVNSYADSLALSVISAVVTPKVKLRPKKISPTSSSSASDIYSLPVDSLVNRKADSGSSVLDRHSIAVTRPDVAEPIHMTLEEVRCYLREFHTSTPLPDTQMAEKGTAVSRAQPWRITHSDVLSKSVDSTADTKRKSCFMWTPITQNKNFDQVVDSVRHKRSRKSLSLAAAGIRQALFNVLRITHLPHPALPSGQLQQGVSHSAAGSSHIAQTGWTFSAPCHDGSQPLHQSYPTLADSPHQRRALPPLPSTPPAPSPPPPPTISGVPASPIGFVRVRPPLEPVEDTFQQSHWHSSFSEDSLERIEPTRDGAVNPDFAASIDQVKNHGWYWGPLSGEAAERLLANEPDGSFLVRDSSDDHYIFSLSFRLNGNVRHVRIEHDHGNFSFGNVTRFRSQTMVEFIEKAIEHSRSGRFLFFLHRRPTHGPTRVQLLHPVSRFRQVQSLQHLCRFVILRCVRRDRTSLLPLPKRLRDYLDTAHYYSEQFNLGPLGRSIHSPLQP